ncbi:hypothetical protein GF420_10625 [candidate division GN15 bacterium]|nr:hypothetical protein [candidate division GN15 bacterium]
MFTRGMVRLAMLVSFTVAAAFLWGVGCSSDDSGTGGDGDNGNGLNADSIVLLANDSMGALMNEMITVTLDNPDSSFRPEDIDFSGAYNMYLEALAADPGNNDARFGAAFCALMTFMGDPDFNAFFEDLANFADSIDGSPISMIPQVSLGGAGLMTGIPYTTGGLGQIGFNPVALDQRIAETASQDDPVINDLQTVFENALLPLVSEARSYLEAIVADTSYRFFITGEMQGNPGAASIEVDNADFRVFLAATNVFESMIEVFLARNLDLPSYDMQGVAQAMRQNHPFLSLRAGNHMGLALDRLLDGSAQVRAAIEALIAEANSGDNQDDDLIPVGIDDIDDLTEARDSILAWEAYFTGPTDLNIVVDEYTDCYWDGQDIQCDYYEETIEMTVDLRQWFDNPLTNLKDFLPGYAVSLDTISLVDDEYELCLVWTATTFATWEFPNPTINGFLPGLTSDSLKTMFGLTSEMWEQTMCDTIR